MAVDWGSIAQVGLQMAGNYANQRSQARAGAANAQQTQNQLAISQNNSQNNVLLQMAQMELLRKQMEEANRMGRAQQVARGDAMANVQDVQIGRPSHITNFDVSGGMRPSALGPNARMAGRELSNQALAALLEGDSFMPINPRGPVDLDANMPQESTFDKIMGGVGAVGGAVNAYKAQQQGQQQQAAMQALWSQMVNGGANASYADALNRFGNMGGAIG